MSDFNIKLKSLPTKTLKVDLKYLRPKDGVVQGIEIATADKDRLLECWNACVGLEDPVAAISAKDAEIGRLRDSLAAFDSPDCFDEVRYFEAFEKARKTLAAPGEPDDV